MLLQYSPSRQVLKTFLLYLPHAYMFITFILTSKRRETKDVWAIVQDYVLFIFLSKNKHTNAEKLTFNKTFLRCWQWYRCNFHLIFIKHWACKQKHFYVSKNFGTLPRHSKRCRENINDNHSFSVKRSFYLFLFAQMVAQSCLWQTNWKNAQFHGI